MNTLPVMVMLFSVLSVPAQQPALYFENYSSEDGLSQLSCFALAQDAKGFLWVGTQDGLNRYDGRQFKVYAKQNEAGKHLPSNAIYSLYFDSVNNLLWTGTSRGLCIYDPSGDSTATFSQFFPYAREIEKLSIKKVVSFRKGEYWIVPYKRGLYCLNTDSRTLTGYFTEMAGKSYITDIVLHEGKIIASLLYSLYELKPANHSYQPRLLHEGYHFPQIETIASYHKRLWIGTISDGCYYIDNPVEKKENIQATGIVFGGVFCFAVDAADELWIGTRGSGIYKYNAVTGKVTRSVHDPYVPSSPATNFVVFLLRDRQGNMWCGLSGGLSRYDPLGHQFGYVNATSSVNGSLPDKVIYSMYRAKDGTQFIGTQNKGLYEWKKGHAGFIHFPASAVVGKANNVIYNITEDEQGNIWSATCGGLMQLERKTRKITYYPENKVPVRLNKMYAIAKLKKADSLLVSTDEGLQFFSTKDKRWVSFSDTLKNIELRSDFAAFRGGRYFYEDGNNTLWLCASGSGLIRYRYLENKLESVEAVNRVAPSVRHLLVEGPVFLLATDNGLVVYDHVNDKLLKLVNLYGTGVSSACNAVQVDNEGAYWVSTNTGLCKLNRQYEVVQTYNSSNGLPFLEYTSSCATRDDNGMLYFGGMEGITFFQPSQLKQNDFSPTPLITGMMVNNEPHRMPADNPAGLHLKHDHNFISFQFAVTNFSNEKSNRFSYRLKGLSDHWSVPATANTAAFTSLPPGHYRFELRSVNSDGKWSNGISTLSFTITAPWWQSRWFMIAVPLLLGAIVIAIIRKRIQRIRKEANLKQQLAEAEMMALRAQMNPHFVFNSLNSIREMILNNENKEASHFLGKFAGLLRTTLDQSGNPFVSLRQTIDHLTRYIEIEQLRNGEFTSRILADDELDPDETMLPSMLIQPFVENALWHGTAAARKNINIDIDFKKMDDQLLCIVEDDGIGFRQSLKNKMNGSKTHHSLGFTNITNRIQLLNEKYDLKSSISIHDKSELAGSTGTGTVVQVMLPLHISES